MRRERDELQSLLDKFERHMAEVVFPLTCIFWFDKDQPVAINMRVLLKK